MNKESIDVEIVESTSDYLKVKLPCLDIPVQMNYQFFQPRVEKGYFRIKNKKGVTRPVAL